MRIINNYKLSEYCERPWGYWRVDEIGDRFVKKIVVVNPNACLSLQSHEHRSEKWKIIDGIAEVVINDLIKTYTANDTVEIPLKAIHRLKNIGTEILIVEEMQFGDILDENDIVRYGDMYDRHVENMRSDTVYIADMDGTLTPARLPMTEEFAEFLEKFVEKHIFYIVSGSDLKKIEEQIPKSIRNKVAGIYCSMGNELYINGKAVYQNDFTPEISMIEKMEKYRKNTAYKGTLYPNYIEVRRGMINFSVLGRDCPHDARVLYKSWDDEHKERETIAKELSRLYPQYNILIGGNISIDVVPRSFGKDQVADCLRKKYKTEHIVFFGDRTEKNGNDYALAQRLIELGNSQIIAVNDPGDVLKFLKEIV